MVLISVLASSLLFVSCEDDAEDLPEPIDAAYVSIYHGAPDTNGINVLVSTGQINNTPYKFKDFTNYLRFFPGDRNMKFIDAITGVVTLVDTTFTFVEYESYSIFLANTLKSLEAVIIEDKFPLSVADKAMVRFIQLSPDAAEMDVVVDEFDLFYLIDFKEGSEFKPVDTGKSTFVFKQSVGENTLITAVDVELQSQQYYTIIMNGYKTPPAGNANSLNVEFIRL